MTLLEVSLLLVIVFLGYIIVALCDRRDGDRSAKTPMSKPPHGGGGIVRRVK